AFAGQDASFSSGGGGGYTIDGGATFHDFPTIPEPANNSGGSIAVSANSNTIVWALSELVSTARSVPYYSSDNGTTWRAASGAPAINVGTGYYWNSPLASDRKTGGTFYLYNNDNGRFYRSTDNGHNFSQVASGLPVDARVFLVANPYVANDLWIVFA